MSDWIELPKPKKEKYKESSKELCCSVSEDDEWKYRCYIPLTPELVAGLSVDTPIEISLRGTIKSISSNQRSNKEDSAELCIRISEVKVPKVKTKMEAFGDSLVDD